MACSKLFSGNLPEITNRIIQYLESDLKSLHSCVLVNRHLCRITIPILWEDPFSVKFQDRQNFLDTYFTFFNQDDKMKLKGFGIPIDSSLIKKPLFNYPSFIKILDTFRVERHTVNWINHLDILPDVDTKTTTCLMKSEKITFPSTYDEDNEGITFELKKVLPDSNKIIDFICISLFKLFKNSDVSLNDFNLSINEYYGGFLFEIYELILDDSKFISKIENFTLDFIYTPDPKFDFQIFLKPLPSLLSSIKHLGIYVDDEILFTRNLMDLIQSQSQLLSLSLFFITAKNFSLDFFKYHSNTLNSISFDCCDLTNILIFEGLQYLTQLESLQFDDCQGITISQSLFDHPNSLKIKTLKVNGRISGIALLIQKVGPYLVHLDLRISDDIENEKAFESIINHCDKIKYLHISLFKDKDIYQLYKLITHIDNRLKYLSLEIYTFNSMILKELGQILPDSLEYFNLNLAIDPDELKNFLNECEHVGLNKLLVRNKNEKNVDVTFDILKEFVKGKKIENFAYEVSSRFNPNNLEHHNLEKLVNEFQSILMMKRYDDLIIEIYDFI